MKSTCIQHPPRTSLVVLREWQIEFCDGDRCAALLLSFFEHWHNIKLEMSEKAKQANETAEAYGDEGHQDTSLVQFHTQEELEAGILGLYKRDTITKSLKLLKEKRAITVSKNPNPKYSFDRTKHFQFYPEVANQYLAENYDLLKNDNASREKPSSSRKSPSTSPKTSSETSSEDRRNDPSSEPGHSDKDEGQDAIPYDEIESYYNETITRHDDDTRSKCISIRTKDRTRALRARWKEPAFRENWRKILDMVTEAKFMRTGSASNPNHRGDLDWIITNDRGYVRVLEGKYAQKNDPGHDYTESETPFRDHFSAEAVAERKRNGTFR